MRAASHCCQPSYGAAMSFPVRPADCWDTRKSTSAAASSADAPPAPVDRSAWIRRNWPPARSPAARTPSCIRVSTSPGATALTWISYSLTSSARISLKRTTAAFDAPYAENPGSGDVAPPPEKFTTRPHRRCIIPGRNARRPRPPAHRASRHDPPGPRPVTDPGRPDDPLLAHHPLCGIEILTRHTLLADPLCILCDGGLHRHGGRPSQTLQLRDIRHGVASVAKSELSRDERVQVTPKRLQHNLRVLQHCHRVAATDIIDFEICLLALQDQHVGARDILHVYVIPLLPPIFVNDGGKLVHDLQREAPGDPGIGVVKRVARPLHVRVPHAHCRDTIASPQA